MRWGQKRVFYGHPKWHWFDGKTSVCGTWTLFGGENWDWLPDDRRPAMARNNVCANCKRAYLKTRPDLQGYYDRLNDKKDV